MFAQLYLGQCYILLHKMMSDTSKAAIYLKQDKLVAFPTETVYGLGGNALSDKAVAAIYEAKGRPTFNPLIVHVASLAMAKKYVLVNEWAENLAEQFWPGPLTMVLPRQKDCELSLLVSAGLDSVGIRMPAHPLARKLLEESGLPLAAPSANRSGKISPTLAAHVQEELGDRVAMILDGGACEVGIESTVVDLTGGAPVILRPGSITKEQLGKIVPLSESVSSQIKAPGMLRSHYAPSKSVRLNATDVREGEGLLVFGRPIKGASLIENLSESGDLKEAAANLFRMLRVLDASDVISIAVMPIPEIGLGVAINDRLRRAAA